MEGFPFPSIKQEDSQVGGSLQNRRCKRGLKEGCTGLKAQVLVPYVCVGSGVAVTFPGRFLE